MIYSNVYIKIFHFFLILGTKKSSDFNFDSGDTRDVNIKVKDNNSAISISSCSALILCMLLVLFLPRVTGMRSQ